MDQNRIVVYRFDGAFILNIFGDDSTCIAFFPNLEIRNRNRWYLDISRIIITGLKQITNLAPTVHGPGHLAVYITPIVEIAERKAREVSTLLKGATDHSIL